MLAGAPTSPLVVEKLSKVIPNGNIFLLTEQLKPAVSFSDHNQVKTLKESILSGEGSLLGWPICKQSVILIPINESPVPNDWEKAIKTIDEENVVGEICVTGKIVTDGYDGMPGASRDASLCIMVIPSTEWVTLDIGISRNLLDFLDEKLSEFLQSMVCSQLRILSL